MYTNTVETWALYDSSAEVWRKQFTWAPVLLCLLQFFFAAQKKLPGWIWSGLVVALKIKRGNNKIKNTFLDIRLQKLWTLNLMEFKPNPCLLSALQ